MTTDPNDQFHPLTNWAGANWPDTINQFIENGKFVARRIPNISSHIILEVAALVIKQVVTPNKIWTDIVVI